MTRISLVLLLAASLLTATVSHADVDVAPWAGLRMGGSFDIQNRSNDTSDRIRLKDAEAFGVVINLDLAQPGKQAELYLGRQATTARSSGTPLAGSDTSVDLTLYQAQFGGLYFPGGRNTGGFVSGVAGITRLEPDAPGLDTHHRAAIALGVGYKLALTSHLLARFDLRGSYTVLDSGGSIFCDGGCSARIDSRGFLQTEASAAMVMRF